MLESRKKIPPPSPIEIMESVAVRKKFGFYMCVFGAPHLWTITTPGKIRKSIYEWYGIDHLYKFRKRPSSSVPVLYQCFYCSRVRAMRTKVCRHCHKMKQTISKKIIHRLMQKDLACACK